MEIRAEISDLLINIVTFNYYFIKKIIRTELVSAKYSNVIDVGCGTGVLSSLFDKKKYFGFDIDPSIIKHAKIKHPGYKFAVGNIVNFKIKKKYDLVIVIGVLHHLDDADLTKSVQTLNSLLSDDGKIVIIEAIYPIHKWNVVGQLIRNVDKGNHIRNTSDYVRFINTKLRVIKSNSTLSGILDYAVIVAHK